jgi:hypothetical protein
VTDRRIIPIAKSSQNFFYINKLNEARENVARRKQKGLKICATATSSLRAPSELPL